MTAPLSSKGEGDQNKFLKDLEKFLFLNQLLWKNSSNMGEVEKFKLDKLEGHHNFSMIVRFFIF